MQSQLDGHALTAGRWSISPWLLVRMTGFPVELMRRIRFARTRELNASAVEFSRELPALIGEVFHEELEENVARLREIAQDAQFREAVFLSNPASFPHIERWIDRKVSRPSKVRQSILTSAMYLQRFCMKNDTASFFGPTYWGKLDLRTHSPLEYAFDGSRKSHRKVFFSHWAANALARWASGFPEATRVIRPRRVPTVRLHGDMCRGLEPTLSQWGAIQCQMELPEHGREFLELVDGDRSVEALSREAEERWGLSPHDVGEILTALTNARLLHASIEIPVGLYEPMHYLVAELRRGEMRGAVGLVEGLLHLADEFESGTLARRRAVLSTMQQAFSGATGEAASHDGQFYADRSLVYEDATRNFRHFRIGRLLVNDLLSLPQILDLLWLVTEREYWLMQGAMANWFRARFVNRTRVPFLEYGQAFVEDGEILRARLDGVAAIGQDTACKIFGALVPSHAREAKTVQWDPSDVRELCEQFGGSGELGVISNPDVLIVAPNLSEIEKGRYRIVLAEVHADRDLLSHSPAAIFLTPTDKDGLVAFVSSQYAAAAEPDEIVADVIATHKHKTSTQLILNGPDVEVEGRSPKPRSRVLQLSDLDVRLDGDRLRLYSPQLRRFVRLTLMRVPVGSLEHTSPLRPFSFPRRKGDAVFPLPPEVPYCPRIEIGKIVIQRRTWRVHFDDAARMDKELAQGWNVDLFRWALRLKTRLGLPERLFGKVEGERKTIHLDFSNYFLVHAFIKAWSQHRGVATLVEALPDVSDLWLEDEDGHYSCELRLGFYRSAAPHADFSGGEEASASSSRELDLSQG